MSSARRRAIPLLLAGVVLVLVIAPIGPLRLFWVPLLGGVGYLLAAAAGGRRGALWVPGVVVTLWGAAEAVALSGAVTVNDAAAALTGLGVGVLVAALLPRVGIPVSPLGIAVPAVLVGVFALLVAHGPTIFSRGWLYGALIGLWGVWELRPQPSRSTT